jgi:hypothetical protein
MGVLNDGLRQRSEAYNKNIGELAYERLRLTRRIEAIDAEIKQYEIAQAANDLVRRDLDTDAAIQAAQVDKPAEEAVRGAEQ